MNRFMELLMAALDRLNDRERKLVLGGGGALIVLLLVFGVWLPISDHVSAQQREVSLQRQDLAWMRQAAEEVGRLRAQGATAKGAQAAPGESLMSLADRSAREQGLGGAIRRIEPAEKGVSVRLEGVGFDRMMQWLGHVREQFGVMVTRADVERANDQGGVNARLVLEWRS
ncbi:type II secretion system protein GspM [Magnetofaba australis]|uniref:Type II secretion system protein M n=1 Tax=Magnetofaba australis IT-1 TaxID=1434232 RepID=A0A1Y2K9H0_9PROT|nr:type II secretion system protein M [Magnetofaba australis]OSM05326.1 putative General secretion pathway M protein [Magnetofaba australis IT-1]